VSRTIAVTNKNRVPDLIASQLKGCLALLQTSSGKQLRSHRALNFDRSIYFDKTTYLGMNNTKYQYKSFHSRRNGQAISLPIDEVIGCNVLDSWVYVHF
jgi:hypothetical protein